MKPENASRIRFNWKVTLFSAVFLTVFLYLGFWQLERKIDKTRLLADEAARELMAPIPLDRIVAGDIPLNGLRVAGTGDYLPLSLFLLDNRVVEAKVGYDVLVPFRDSSTGLLLLINRGFVAMGRTRADKPAIPPLQGNPQQFIGSIYAGNAEDVRRANLYSDGPGAILLQVESAELASVASGLAFYGSIVRLSDIDPNALPRNWSVTVMSPERHQGYAYQWFTMAFAITAAWFFFTFRIKRGDIDE